MKYLKVLFSAIMLAVLLVAVTSEAVPWHQASRKSAEISPLASELDEAIVQVFAARTYGKKGYLAVHTWVTWKEKGASTYTVAEILGYLVYYNKPVVIVKEDLPDRYWFGNKPQLLSDIRGELAEKAIPNIKSAIASYPYPESYRLWPGPNSNTFVAHIIREVPELTVELPTTAIGKDWLNHGALFAKSQTGTGFQFSILGALGFTIAYAEGIEVNILGLTFGIDVFTPSIKLPIVGRLGFKDQPIKK